MAIEVACIMAAGQAGLKSMPYFVDEFIARGIPQIVPRPFDHDSVQIQGLDKEFRDNWTNNILYGMGDSRQLATKMELDDVSIARILNGSNPIAAAEMGATLHDSPARLAAWCRLNLANECRKTLDLWDTYKNLRSLGTADQLAVVIPFCPEGPTSGTVGMYLGATMIQCCVDDRRDDVIVWGVELCPPIPARLTGDPARNVFRGYVAREEMLGGVPLSGENPHDDDRKRCFHINIAFDGGYSPPPYTAEADVLPALDRAAAQSVACLLTKAATGDKGETADALRNGTGRWNACMVSVVSESSYSPAFRCLGYRVKLPWNRNPERWSKRKPAQKKDRFLSSIEDIEQSMESEEVQEVQTWFKELKQKADELRNVGFRDRLFSKKDQTLLDQAQSEDERLYKVLLTVDPPEARTMVRNQPFCISIGLSAEMREDNAERIVDRDSPDHAKPLSEMLGIASSNNVQSGITEFCRKLLERDDIDVNAPSRALFQEIRAISIRSPENRLNDTDFRPTETVLRAYLDSTVRELSPPYYLTHDLNDGEGKAKPLLWEPFKVDHANNARKARTERPVPVDYSFLVLARVKEGEKFQDLSTYQRLKNHHDGVANSENWFDHARYYAFRVPEALLLHARRGAASSNDASSNGRQAASDFIRESA